MLSKREMHKKGEICSKGEIRSKGWMRSNGEMRKKGENVTLKTESRICILSFFPTVYRIFIHSIAWFLKLNLIHICLKCY